MSELQDIARFKFGDGKLEKFKGLSAQCIEFIPHLPQAGSSALPAPAGCDTLTSREREILIEVAAGLSNAEIAAKLFLAEATVKTRRQDAE